MILGFSNINGTGTQGATTFTGAITTPFTGTQCLHEVAGVIGVTGSDCGSGGGSMTWPAAAGIAVYGGSSAWGTSLTAPAGTIVGTTDTQTLTNKTVDGVTPTTLGYLDATSSVQTQLNALAPQVNPTFTGTVTGRFRRGQARRRSTHSWLRMQRTECHPSGRSC